MKNFMEWLFITLGAVVVIFYGAKLLLFTRMLCPERWFPVPKSFFLSMGEWAVVTGASEGIGRQYAFALAEHGMNVVIMSRTKVTLDKVAKEISESTQRVVKVVVADFTKDNIFTDIEEHLKYLDVGVLVNNVGVMPSVVPRRFLEGEDLEQTITRVINCNVKTMVKMCKIILPGMENRFPFQEKRGDSKHCIRNCQHSISYVFAVLCIQSEYRSTSLWLQTCCYSHLITRITFADICGEIFSRSSR
ncbi:17-beta-hydroxysteroid dehydrogenase type 3 isoform X1 [Syngnathus typhle]|uniref:17-beta-hydroxysteroid dehydrogenase type 3 isoform X1 n=1 Tax=Syngnathus typhle TaxID=161592 RepID=UPI002A6B3D01|nr:17-beta-hydroxysteroid dehydrogenase type 3 isoform X1 [Syngnathus typhle]